MSIATLLLASALVLGTVSAQLRPDYYANICPNVDSIVRHAVEAKVNETFVAVPATLRLFFHDCMVSGCDASIMVASTPNNTAEMDHNHNFPLDKNGFDTIIKAKLALDSVPECQNKVSCADILALATRDVIALAGGPSYEVELGRLDGLSSTAASVHGKLPRPSFNLDQLNHVFATIGLSQTDMIALSAAHSVGVSRCKKFSKRIYGFKLDQSTDPAMNATYATELRVKCPTNVDSRVVVDMDPITPRALDNQYYRNLQNGVGLLTSDQVLFTDARSRPVVDAWAQNKSLFERNFVTAMTKLGRAGVKTGSEGNIRYDCSVLNN